MWWTKSTFGLYLQEFKESGPDGFGSTHSADNKPTWRVAIFAMLGVGIGIPQHLKLSRQLLIPIHSEPSNGQVFPYQILFPQNNTAQNCLSQCSTFYYPAAGMKSGDECCM